MRPERFRFWPVLAFTHRWLGIAGCLLFLLWFLSGIAMMYVRMPALSAEERLAHAQPLAVDGIRIAPSQAASTAGNPEAAEIELGMLGSRPVYRIGRNIVQVVFADSGVLASAPSVEAATAAARQFLGGDVSTSAAPLGANTAAIRYVEQLDRPDQWTLQLRQHLPLHRLTVNDGRGTELYVSNLTGDVVLDTTRRERVLAYLGPVAHWLYLPVLRRNGSLWTQVILWTSGIGCLLCLSGLLAGLLRFSPTRRFRLQQQSAMSPYAGWLKWHHYAGLTFGLITLTWTFSGLLSMGPFPWLSHGGLTSGVARATAGGTATVDDLSADDVRAAAGALRSSIALKEMRLVAFRGRRYWLGLESATQHRLVPANGPWMAFNAFPRAEMEAAARNAGLGTVADLAWLEEYDEYYYDRSGRRPLPVLRARYTDEATTWSYLDPASGSAALVVGRRDRLNRWLYHGLHSLDPAWLRNRRPLWDVVVIVLSLGGGAGVATSLVPAWRRLRTLFPRTRRTASPAVIRSLSKENES